MFGRTTLRRHVVVRPGEPSDDTLLAWGARDRKVTELAVPDSSDV
jgi:hypothetical protein